MAKIHLPQLNKSIEALPQLSLMKNLLDNNVPVASSCGGDAICGKCVMEVRSEKINPMSDLEKQTLEKAQAPKGQRLSCQIKVLSDMEVKTTYW